MFLQIAYALFIIQTIAICVLILPIPIRIRRIVIELATFVTKDFRIKCCITVVILVMFGLYIENFLASQKYSDFKYDISETVKSVSKAINQHEIMLKLYRAQRNMYLMFIVNFNWVVLYGLQSFIAKLYTLELENNMLKTKENKTDDDKNNNTISDEKILRKKLA